MHLLPWITLLQSTEKRQPQRGDTLVTQTAKFIHKVQRAGTKPHGALHLVHWAVVWATGFSLRCGWVTLFY